MASEILDKDLALEEKHKNILNIIIHEVNRTQSLVEDIVTLSKYDRLDFKLYTDNVDIKDIIGDVCNVLNTEASNKSIQLIDESSSCHLKIDQAKIKQVLFNIIKSEIMYTEEGSVRIYNKNLKKTLEICIEDTGIGIDKKDINNIFERFYRVDKNRSRYTGGSGLGLPIVEKIISKHFGSIEVKSKLDKGSKFTIVLPLTQNENYFEQ